MYNCACSGLLRYAKLANIDLVTHSPVDLSTALTETDDEFQPVHLP